MEKYTAFYSVIVNNDFIKSSRFKDYKENEVYNAIIKLLANNLKIRQTEEINLGDTLGTVFNYEIEFDIDNFKTLFNLNKPFFEQNK